MTTEPHAGPHFSIANTHSPLLMYHHPKVLQLVVPKLKVVAAASGARDTNRNYFLFLLLPGIVSLHRVEIDTGDGTRWVKLIVVTRSDMISLKKCDLLYNSKTDKE